MVSSRLPSVVFNNDLWSHIAAPVRRPLRSSVSPKSRNRGCAMPVPVRYPPAPAPWVPLLCRSIWLRMARRKQHLAIRLQKRCKAHLSVHQGQCMVRPSGSSVQDRTLNRVPSTSTLAERVSTTNGLSRRTGPRNRPHHADAHSGARFVKLRFQVIVEPLLSSTETPSSHVWVA
jgi:hypothetical protein